MIVNHETIVEMNSHSTNILCTQYVVKLLKNCNQQPDIKTHSN